MEYLSYTRARGGICYNQRQESLEFAKRIPEKADQNKNKNKIVGLDGGFRKGLSKRLPFFMKQGIVRYEKIYKENCTQKI